MANVLVMLEFLDSEPLCASLEALGQARRLGSALGLTVYALVPMQSIAPQKRQQLGQLLGYYGADSVVMLTSDAPRAESELRFAPYARALLQACDELPPKLWLMADTPAARDVAPRLAARLGGVFLSHGEPVCEHAGLRIYDADGQPLAVSDDPLADEMFAPMMVPVVMTLPAGRYALSRGSTAVPVRFMAALDGDPASERTPVPGGGFSEESHDPHSRSARLWFQSGDKPSEDAMPPLFVVAEDALPFDRRLAYTAIGIGPRSAEREDVQHALPIAESAPSGLRVAMEAALAKPRERTVEPALANLLPFDDQSDSEPAISVGRSWDASDISTGDTEPRTPAAPASDSALPVVPPVVVEPVAPFPLATASDSEIWDGAPTVDAEKADRDAAPDAELDGIDTEPIEDTGTAPSKDPSAGKSEQREETP
ncbi:MAG TPA: hypothetical protein PKI49_02855 [Pseudomonadota bacterium]|nr:hypothetical protein [Pseudomonadota bacterium]HNK45330.1 hypothetical protein [Pseudomonadota bacterium]HNN49605.1 hypothetical protein [Pseudomonadota bacterium]HNO67421.1 hypothetical protein [Pseudomonadota bacterium]